MESVATTARTHVTSRCLIAKMLTLMSFWWTFNGKIYKKVGSLMVHDRKARSAVPIYQALSVGQFFVAAKT